MSSQYNCDYCNNLVYDEEIEGYVCDVDMDEDDYARLLSSSYKQCPYYQSNTAANCLKFTSDRPREETWWRMPPAYPP